MATYQLSANLVNGTGMAMTIPPPESDYPSSSEEDDDPTPPPLMEEKLKSTNQAKLVPKDLDPPLTKFKKKPLPTDIISNILSRISGIKLVDLQFTCKEWFSLTKDHFFIDLHLAQTSGLPGVLLFFQGENLGRETSNILALNHLFQPQFSLNLKRESISSPILITPPCNGLICIYNFTLNITILNPTTREFIDLPRPTPNKVKLTNPYPKCYFGFDPLRKQYKVVRFYYRKMDHANEIYDLVCEIFILGKMYWRIIGIINWYPSGPGIHVNGFLYWIIGAKNPTKDKIMALNLSTGKFREIYLFEVTNQYGDDGNEVISLAKLEGNICVIFSRFFDSTLMDIWTLKDFEKQKWVRKCHIRFPSYMNDQRYKIEVISINGQKVLLRSGRIFYEYCLQKRRFEKVYQANINGSNIKSFSFIQSLVSLAN